MKSREEKKTGLQGEDAPSTRGQPSSPWASLFSSVREGLLLSISQWSERPDLPDDLGPRTAGLMGMDSSLWIHPGGPRGVGRLGGA